MSRWLVIFLLGVLWIEGVDLEIGVWGGEGGYGDCLEDGWERFMLLG